MRPGFAFGKGRRQRGKDDGKNRSGGRLSDTRSLDLFGDGSLIVVPLAEHGALGLFVALADGRRYFFKGDTLGQPDQSIARPDVIQPQDWSETTALQFYPGWVQSHASRSEASPGPRYAGLHGRPENANE